MSSAVEEDGVALRRVLAAFDPATAHPPAMEAVAGLAALLDAELQALFVEDVSLLRLAALPFARQYDHRGGAGRPVEAAALEAEVRVLAARAERHLAAAAAGTRARWSFRRTRGPFAAEVAAAAEQADLIVLETSSRPLGTLPPLASAARSVVERTAAPVLLLPPDAALGPPISLLYGGAAVDRRAALTAARLAARYGAVLNVVLRDTAAAEVEPRLHECAELLGPTGVRAAYRRSAEPAGEALARLIGSAAGGILTIGAASPLPEPQGFWACLSGARCSVLLVR